MKQFYKITRNTESKPSRLIASIVLAFIVMVFVNGFIGGMGGFPTFIAFAVLFFWQRTLIGDGNQITHQIAMTSRREVLLMVAHMGAMQAQDYRMMRWAVMMRMRKPSAEAFRLAYDAGEIIRLHLHRGTWQLVSSDDYGWMLRLFADKAERVIRGWMKANKVTIEDEELYDIREILVDTCEAKERTENGGLAYGSATKEDFSNALDEND